MNIKSMTERITKPWMLKGFIKKFVYLFGWFYFISWIFYLVLVGIEVLRYGPI